MSGDRKQPIDGKILVKYGDMSAEGDLTGLTVAQVREMIARDVPALGLPADAVARIVTMDGQDEAWKKVAAPQADSLFIREADWGTQMFQGVSKDVPDDYAIRKADVFLEFRDRG